MNPDTLVSLRFSDVPAADLTQEAEQHDEMWGEEDADQKKYMLEFPGLFCTRGGKNQYMPSFHCRKGLPLTEG